jgi:hypothetical protein
VQQSRGLIELFVEANNIIRKPKSLLKSMIDTIEQSDRTVCLKFLEGDSGYEQEG